METRSGARDREEVTTGQRLALLEGVPAFTRLPEGTLEELAALLGEERYPPGDVVVAEGDEGDRLYLIAEGRAEVSVAGSGEDVPLATLGPGELFGEIALLQPDSKRQATVAAITSLLLLSLPAEDFRRVLEAIAKPGPPSPKRPRRCSWPGSSSRPPPSPRLTAAGCEGSRHAFSAVVYPPGRTSSGRARPGRNATC